MKGVYILNRNLNNNGFNSLLMVNLNALGVQFNNIDTTKTVFFNNILVLIPEQGIANKGDDYILNMFVENAFVFEFRVRMVLTVNREDYEAVKRIVDCYGRRNNTKYYISDSYNTLLSSIISEDCATAIALST